MIWLTWRQFRAQAIALAIILFSVAAVLAYTGPHLLNIYRSSGIAGCHPSDGGRCTDVISNFDQHFQLLSKVSSLVIAIPALIGAFWGGPLIARELEAGTSRVAWTQSVTRTRWFVVKVFAIGAACVIATLALSLIIQWWSNPIDLVHANRFGAGEFSQRGIVPGAYAIFAFAVGLLAGAVVRRTLPAVAIAFGVFFAVRVAVTQWVRPHFMSPVVLKLPLFSEANAGKIKPNSWVVKSYMVDGAGHHVIHPCEPAGAVPIAKDALQPCLDRLGIREVFEIQPANRFWTFQFIEAGLFVLAALALIGFAFWWVRRRLA